MTDFSSLLAHFTRYNLDQIDGISFLRNRIVLPLIPRNAVYNVVKEATALFKVEPSLLRINGPLSVIGDLHGHLLDLMRIVQNQGLPSSECKYLFLGDIVDRGEFNFETMFFILLLKVNYPSQVFAIRGNHEFQCMAQQCGFFAEVNECYKGSDVFKEFVNTFNQLPIAAVIDQKYFCVHGGIGPDVDSLDQIDNIKRPIREFADNPIITSLLWSDPSEAVESFSPSVRGTGYVYGKKALDAFLKKNKMSLMIRAHQCIQTGIEKMHDGKLITVFSASNYCGYSANNGGMLFIDKDENINTIIFDPLRYIKRREALFVQVSESFIKPSKKTTLNAVKSLLDVQLINQTSPFLLSPLSPKIEMDKKDGLHPFKKDLTSKTVQCRKSRSHSLYISYPSHKSINF